MRLTVLLFGSAAEAAGRAQIYVESATLTSQSLLRFLREGAPSVTSDGSNTFVPIASASWAAIVDASVLAVNQEYVALDHDMDLKATDEVALIPPISGG